eukprot:TRINITY_DN10297_c0_g1_i1.p1 TRINITY_DN10297_c0_g1~~TRINITY_DN10297_c0_g1_i1.p1  ORF type:complete len:356 (-),score=68.40 TRINITY_DN10297_c0_g1_i1:1062-2075(-)
MNAFKYCENQYRRPAVVDRNGKTLPGHKQPKTDYSGVLSFLDFNSNSPNLQERAAKVSCHVPGVGGPVDIFSLPEWPGFFFIPNPFTPLEQMHWISQALEEYTQPPNSTILDAQHGPVPSLWPNWIREMETGSRGEYAMLMDKLKWATLGYQYQWTERRYDRRRHAPFPEDLAHIVQAFAQAVGVADYRAEAATVNYYMQDMVMHGHLDDAEYDMDKPIVSMSFGASAVFLLGGETKDVVPLPMFVNSGDVMIMGGRARRCYHGIARILEDSVPPYLLPSSVPPAYEWCARFLEQRGRRININVRQVFSQDKDQHDSNLVTDTNRTQGESSSALADD